MDSIIIHSQNKYDVQHVFKLCKDIFSESVIVHKDIIRIAVKDNSTLYIDFCELSVLKEYNSDELEKLPSNIVDILCISYHSNSDMLMKILKKISEIGTFYIDDDHGYIGTIEEYFYLLS